MKLRNLRCQIILVVFIFGNNAWGDAGADPEAVPDPVADPESDPEAESDPSADPQNRYRWGYPPPGYPGGSGISGYPPVGGPSNGYGRSACEMTNKCCGMDKANCCIKGGQKRCYTIWDRKCEREDQPECQLRVDRHCHDVRVRECRVITEVAYRNFPVLACFPKPMTECFEYQKKICSPTVIPEVHTITWVNQKLTPISEKEETHCFDQRTVNCSTSNFQETVTVQEKKERKVTDNQRRCRMVQKKSQDQEIMVPVTRIVYNTMCYNVPKSTCSQNACRMTGYCSQNTNVCSMTDFSSSTVCPEPVAGAENADPSAARTTSCQQVQQPVCYESGACQPNYQQCCAVSSQRICRQVPQRIVEQVKQVLPGSVAWSEECNDYPFERVEYYYEPVTKVVNRTKENCEPIKQPHCHNYTVPTFGVNNETKSDKVTVTLPACHQTTVKDRYCHTFPTADIGCRNSTVRKGFRINKVICDQMVTKQECFNIPVADCRVGSSNKCRMVPRQICPEETCSNSGFCQQCDAFRNGPGFGSCSSTTCGTYYPNDQTLTGSATNWKSGVVGTEDVPSGAVSGYQEGTDQAYPIEESASGNNYYPAPSQEAGGSRRQEPQWNEQDYYSQGGFNPSRAVPNGIAEPRQDGLEKTASLALDEESNSLKS